MILYIAAVYTNNISLHGQTFARFDDAEKAARLKVHHILDSYHYVSKQPAVDAMRRDGVKIFLDSGAFSAYTQNVTIDLDGYCDYIRRNSDIILVPSVLDSIGNDLETYRNQKAMEAQGVSVLPCFHYGEDERYLEYYVANYPYITIGGVAQAAKPQLVLWLDRIWKKYMTYPDGMPKVQVHGFGITRLDIMQRYPWYSVDSSSWVQSAGTGGIMIPGIGNIYMSEDSPARKEWGSKHISTVLPAEREVIEYEIAKRGFCMERLQKTYVARWAFNLLTYTELGTPDAPPKPLALRQDTLF